MALASLPYFRGWDGHVGAGTCGLVETGFLVLVGSDQLEKLRRNTERLRQLGVVTEVVEGQDLRQAASGMETGDGAAAA